MQPTEKYVWPGGYENVVVTEDGGVLHWDCWLPHADPEDPQWNAQFVGPNWEDAGLYCDHCSKLIQPEYED